ncbi:MAG: ParB/RepB/Spo0J family partition protein [Candidatus Abyssobacteria bacterium SURF_17]|uniref:ParB/RepB/Spo0J family partition protein n=1 Tax=Candidatus Abyssobacteria bacterium SURF_17 TaxID=2093361 RepID=A0A419EXH8_9BACT|nr:MAG: ParB/RepB/Spo0J family partition protein [Candidatus Abyssubacteria bacterium SURF_17]
MVEKKVLGKGLKALIGEPEELARYEATQWQHIGLDEIEPNPFQPREDFDEAKLSELAASIKAHGVLQPIIVRQSGSKYQIIAGERRWRAAQRADMMSIPALVKDAGDEEMLRLALIENLQRQDLNPIEEATAYKSLIDEFGLTQELLSMYVGKDRSTIANTMRLLGLPVEVQAHVSRGTLSMGHARALLSLADAATQLDLCKRIFSEDLSVRQVERLVQTRRRTRPRRHVEADPDVRLVEEELQRALGTKVRIRQRGKRGRVEIDYYSRDDLEALINRLLGHKERL